MTDIDSLAINDLPPRYARRTNICKRTSFAMIALAVRESFSDYTEVDICIMQQTMLIFSAYFRRDFNDRYDIRVSMCVE